MPYLERNLRKDNDMNESERLIDLEKRVKELEKIIKKQLPLPLPEPSQPDWPNPWPIPKPSIPDIPWIPKVPYDPPYWPKPYNPDDGTRCTRCGMLWKGVMGYVCPDHYCPMGAGPVIFCSK
jgi:hypothetical protein